MVKAGFKEMYSYIQADCCDDDDDDDKPGLYSSNWRYLKHLPFFILLPRFD